MEFCSIIARNYLAYARVLAESLSEHHPGTRLSLLIIDDEDKIETDSDTYSVLRPADLDLDPVEFKHMAAMYDVTELSTAVKPWFLTLLLDRGASEVVYLDPDIKVFAALDDIPPMARRHGIVLTPHRLTPIPRDGKSPSEGTILACGTFNLGFIAVGESARPFLSWWKERLLRDCIRALDEGLFVDQRWVDFVPSLFEHTVLRDPAVNIAYWNADERPIEASGEGYTVAGRPLRFFHFSGFDPSVPQMLSKRAKEPRILLSDHPSVAALCREYTTDLARHDHETRSRVSYAFAHDATGLELGRITRRLYRSELIAAETSGDVARIPPSPFGEPGAFVDWLNAPSPDVSNPAITRFLYALYQARPRLQRNFPSLTGPEGDRYVSWIRKNGPAKLKMAAALMPVEAPASTRASASTPARRPLRKGGVNVAGYFRAESGVGEQARLLLAAFAAAKIPYAVLTLREAPNRQEARFEEREHEGPVYDTTIICVNADGTPRFVRTVGRELAERTYTIGFWAWEIEHLPERMRDAATLLDEVWGDSTHTAAAIRAAVSTPVFAVPPPIVPPAPAEFSRADLGLPDGFIFLFCFDFLSVVERKNPLGLIAAFSRAFAPGEGPTLVIKSVAGDKRLDQLERLRLAAAERPDIVVIDGYLASEKQHALMQSCDAYVSLHRAEGFGLTIAEAMAVGKPVIATGYSGNMDFTTQDNCHLVPHRMVPIPPGCDPYPEGEIWAEPDIDEAARLMRLVFDDPAAAAAKAERARRDVATLHSPDARAVLVAERLAAAASVRARRDAERAAEEKRAARRAGVRRVARLLVPKPMRPWIKARLGRRSPRLTGSTRR